MEKQQFCFVDFFLQKGYNFHDTIRGTLLYFALNWHPNLPADFTATLICAPGFFLFHST
jgi:hypothetical protein